MSGLLETWRGDVTLSECDELGHLNMRYYLSKAKQARQMFFMGLGLPRSFEAGTPSTVRFRECHIKFLKEARPAMSLSIQTGIVALRDTDMDLVHIMSHRDGTPAATIVETVDHIYLRTDQAFHWPKRVEEAAANYMTELPDMARPRGLSLEDPMTGPALEEVSAFKSQRISLGAFTQKEVDSVGYIPAHHFVGRLSDSITSFTQGWPEIAEGTWETSQIVGVMLEFRLRIHRYAFPGMGYYLYSGLRSHTDKVRQIIHNFVDPIGGDNYASLIAVNGLIDLKTRRFARPSQENLDQLSKATIPGLHA